MAYWRLRESGVRVMTYVDDVLQSDPFAPGLGATVSLFDIYFWVKKFIYILFLLALAFRISLVGDPIEARLIMTCCVSLILIQTCFETMEAFQMTAQDLIRIEFRIFFVFAVRKRSDVASFGKAKEVGG